MALIDNAPPMRLKSLKYFASNQTDPLWEVSNVMYDKKHPQYMNLWDDLNAIDEIELIEFVELKEIDCLIGREENKDLARREHFIIDKLRKEIAYERIIKLTEDNNRPAPYNSENLSGFFIDKNNLISTGDFNIKNDTFKHQDFVYELCPLTHASNSNYWISKAILKCIKSSSISFKVRLDPLKEFKTVDYRPLEYKMWVHGKPLDWLRLVKLKNDEYGQWLNEREYVTTDFVWSPRNEEVHFTCEEYPSFSYRDISISRYFHAIFNKKTGSIMHCDGALRVYDSFELLNRKEHHVKSPEVRKVGKRIKIFQFEAKENQKKEITQSDFCDLAVNFFVWNYDAQRYFN